VQFLRRLRKDIGSAYGLYRVGLGRAILLGLEFLIAGDIIRTVATSPTFQSLGILGSIVLIRTFLSLALNGSRRPAALAEREKGRSGSLIVVESRAPDQFLNLNLRNVGVFR